MEAKMRNQMLSSKAINIFINMTEFDRLDWKFKKISSAQSNFLIRYVEPEDLIKIDRGIASLLMDCLMKVIKYNEETTDANVLGELYKIVKKM
jgi:hypothetical protein